MIDPARKHGDWAPDPFHSWAQPKRRRLLLGIAIQSCRINRKMLRGRMPAELYRQAHELVAELSSGGEEKPRMPPPANPSWIVPQGRKTGHCRSKSAIYAQKQWGKRDTSQCE